MRTPEEIALTRVAKKVVARAEAIFYCLAAAAIACSFSVGVLPFGWRERLIGTSWVLLACAVLALIILMFVRGNPSLLGSTTEPPLD